MQPFADNLKFFLSARRLNTHALAAQIGGTAGQLEAWAAGRAEPGLEALVRLSDVLQVSVDRLLRVSLAHQSVAADIRMLVLDVDGVLTDGGIYLTEEGDEIKKFHARDGRGIITAQKRGIEVAFLSGGQYPAAIQRRAERLGVKCWYVGTENKTVILEQWLAARGLDYSQVAYIGDDANDLGVIAKAGLTACPADASHANREAVDVILRLPGGQGCVREFIEDHLGIVVD